MPSLEELNQQYRDNGLKILLVNLKEEEEAVASFISKNNYSSTVLLDTAGNVAELYSVYGIPAAYLIDKKGKVAFRSAGFLDWGSEKMNSLVSTLIKE